MALTIARTESQLSATTAFQAMDNLMASTVSSSFVVPSGVSRLVSVDVGVTNDTAEESAVLLRFAGNGMSDGEQYVCGAALAPIGSSTGATSNYASKDTDFNVISGNSIECSIAVTDAATISATVVMTFA
jgi:hypothetical protein